MSRRSPRYRADLAVTATPLLGGERAVCRTLDVSDAGMSLATSVAWFPIGSRLSLTMFDEGSGTALEVIGDVVREAAAPSWILGILLIEPPPEWRSIVATAAHTRPVRAKPAKRLRVLVVGDEHRQRGALALYVTSGWDVLFASDDDSISEAVETIPLDAVVAELDDSDPRLPPIMAGVSRLQPQARRIVRGARGTTTAAYVHRYVARDAGLEALLDAMRADY